MENKFELIERYLMHDMSMKERLEFEELLINDPELRRELVLRNEINEAIQEDDVIDLRSELNQIMNESTSSKVRKLYKYCAVAATIIVLLAIGSIFFSPWDTKSDTDFFQEYYHPYPAIMSFRSPADRNETEKILYNAFNYYDTEEYELALISFQKVLSIDSLCFMSQFYLAVCEIEKENYANAQKYLLDLTQKEEHIFWEQSHWYLSLVYLKLDQTEQAKSVLRKIIDEDMDQRNDSESILNQLD